MNQRWTKVKDLKIGTQIAVYDDGSLVWDEVVSIKSAGRERVYDIEVENSHNFVGNGILAHNTYIFGNLGIGTTTPTHKLEVAGDIAALGFVNISTAEAKKDISFLGDDDYENILNKIASTSVATYLYANDQIQNPNVNSNPNDLMSNDLIGGKRLGLIAEEAPVEVLSADRKGVDLYKMVSFSWAGIKELALRLEGQQKEIEAMKIDIADIKSKIQMSTPTPEGVGAPTESVGGVGSDAGIISQGWTWVLEQFRQLGISIASGVISAKEFIAEKITARTAALDNIEMKDAATGDVYCVRMENGELTKTKGTCTSTDLTNSPQASSVPSADKPAPASSPEPAPSEPNPSVDSGQAAATEPAPETTITEPTATEPSVDSQVAPAEPAPSAEPAP